MPASPCDPSFSPRKDQKKNVQRVCLASSLATSSHRARSGLGAQLRWARKSENARENKKVKACSNGSSKVAFRSFLQNKLTELLALSRDARSPIFFCLRNPFFFLLSSFRLLKRPQISVSERLC